MPISTPLARRAACATAATRPRPFDRVFSGLFAVCFPARFAVLLACLIILPAGCRDPRESPTGKNLYLQHCAACHGESGDGSGPLAASLVTPPSDLRKIAARNGGRFDESDVMAYIDGRKNVAEHGTREMPVWGAVFQEENRPEHYPAYTSLLHSRALTDYLRSIQE